mmetsp:Transcript_14753/g.14169  ORF Transcript_14753/g.14169 Transcript_14753/m.14169 type:complete len:182 (+) Transcript_14753:112-657(+)
MRNFSCILQLISAYHFFSTCNAFHASHVRSHAVDRNNIKSGLIESYTDKLRCLPSGRLMLTSLYMSESSNDENEDEEEDENEKKEVNMAEFLMAQAEKEMKEKKDKEAFDANLKKKLITKKRSDREYEEYWDKQKKGGGKEEQVNDAAVYRAYYSLKKNETLTQKLGGDRVMICQLERKEL